MIVVVIFAIWGLSEMAKTANEAETARKRRFESQKSTVNSQLSQMSDLIDRYDRDSNHGDIDIEIAKRIRSEYGSSASSNLDSYMQTLIRDVSEIKNLFEELQKSMKNAISCSKGAETAPLSSLYDQKKHEITRKLAEMQQINERCQARRKEALSFSLGLSKVKPFIMSEDYGHPDKTTLTNIDELAASGISIEGNHYSRDDLLNSWEAALNANSLSSILKIRIDVLKHIAFSFARIKPIDPQCIDRCSQIFSTLAGKDSLDIYLADLYAKKQLGNDSAVRSAISDFLRKQGTAKSDWLSTIASFLMWIESYQPERDVLQFMLAEGVAMNQKAQERLHFLSMSGDAPLVMSIDTDDDVLHFDTSSLHWDDKNIISFFDNLLFQERQLDYALAIREEDQGLGVPTGFVMPDRDVYLSQVNEVFDEEYAGDVHTTDRKCVALASGVQESIDAILVSPTNYPEMAIAAITERIGKKLNIKFYTLYVPSGSTDKDKAGVLSLSKKLNPIIAMWEDGLKQTMLKTIERMLNNQSSPKPADTSLTGETPVF
ncbi:MAG: hypothetical protein IKF78_04370 [Atopobiaceae bacterium]|nr:hypothetical protein [Atopobiaceae bacterium]